jgi:hypothetical protein
MAARAAPDGYTFVLVAAGVAINPSLYREVRYDPLRDFAAITLGVAVPNILIVHPSVPAASVPELIALAKSRAGQLTFASAGNGTSGHLALELFKLRAGMDAVHVPYKGGGPALAEVVAGQVQALFSLALAATPQIKAGEGARDHQQQALGRRAGTADGGGARLSRFRGDRLVRLARAGEDATRHCHAPERRDRNGAERAGGARAAAVAEHGAGGQQPGGLRRFHQERARQVGGRDQARGHTHGLSAENEYD